MDPYLLTNIRHPLQMISPGVLVLIALITILYLSRNTIWRLRKPIRRLMTSDPYSDFHYELNVVPTDPTSGDRYNPRSKWMNMGYWADAQTFPQACEALAKKVILSAHCVEGGRVLDVGHGCGDSLLLYLLDPSIPRPAFIQGITSERTQVNIATARCSSVTTSGDSTPPIIEILHGDAVYRPEGNGYPKTKQHPLDPMNSSSPFTSITAIDCAFHFRTRKMFLSQCLNRLAPGGYIGLADMGIVPVSTGPTYMHLLRNFLTRAICVVLSIPVENMLTPDAYLTELHDIGFVDCKINVITEDVFPPLAKFLQSRSYRKDLSPFWWFTGFIFDIWCRICGGTYIIVEARKPLA
ncbi:hypothetical protein FRC03_000632 [Tulasnella sp. 419]|nr:hypothetical protein FRC03_000632 [Tulasnella sp. 419]